MSGDSVGSQWNFAKDLRVGSSSSVSCDGFAASKPSSWTGNYSTEILPDFKLHTIHVNTVSNVQYRAKWRSRGRHLKKTMSGTSKTNNKARLRFVCDKKKVTNLHGVKATRIEFTENAKRSANYTTNVKPCLQPYYRNIFNLLIMAQGEIIQSEGPHVVNNVNYTSYMYGVSNPYTFLFNLMNIKNKDTYTPLFFSSVNVADKDYRHQIFSSMTMNSQRLAVDMRSVRTALSPVFQTLEVHKGLNYMCCLLGEHKEAFLTTGEKLKNN